MVQQCACIAVALYKDLFMNKGTRYLAIDTYFQHNTSSQAMYMHDTVRIRYSD